MLLVLVRIVAVVVGTAFFLPAIPVALVGLSENPWLVVIGILNGLLGAWLISAGWFGTLSGRPPRVDSNSLPRMPNTP